MEKVLLIVAASVFCGVSAALDGRNFFVSDKKIYADAQSYCREKYTMLSTVRSMEDVATLTAVSAITLTPAWIGMTNRLKNWTWSYNDNEAAFYSWAPDRPNYVDGRNLCVQMYNNSLWFDVSCDSVVEATVCSDISGDQVTFSYINESMTWSEAQAYCRAQHTDLAIMRSSEECDRVVEAMEGTVAWIGLYRDDWVWDDGGNASFKYWGTKDTDGPLDNCVAADFLDSGKWGTWNCNDLRPFYCFAVPFSKQVLTLQATKSSSVDLNNPKVLDDLLAQFKQKLKDQGVPGNLTLTWRKQPNGQIFNKEKNPDD